MSDELDRAMQAAGLRDAAEAASHHDFHHDFHLGDVVGVANAEGEEWATIVTMLAPPNRVGLTFDDGSQRVYEVDEIGLLWPVEGDGIG